MKKDIRFGCDVNLDVLDGWKETITKKELIRDRLEEALRENTSKHKKRV